MPVFTVVDFLPGLEGFGLPFRDRAHILREIRTPLMHIPQLIDEETEFLARLVFDTFWQDSSCSIPIPGPSCLLSLSLAPPYGGSLFS